MIKHKSMKRPLIFILLTALLSCTTKQEPETWEKRLEWWKDARFGMFIHWGPVSLKGTEISWSRGREIPVEEYDNLYKQFNPVHFDAEAWVALAKEAGMKYIVFTSKHHDGFCMWDTEYTDYNIMNTPFGRDVVGELATACRKYGIALGLYHSTCDWHHPDFPLTSPGGREKRAVYDLERYADYLKNQSVELIQKYGPLLVMWYDVPQEFDSIRGQGVINRIREVQDNILVNNRTGAPGDFDTPEQKLGNYQDDRPWETCMTIARQWAWKPNDIVKSLEQSIHSLVRTAGGDGNLLYNVGPMPDGRIEPLQAERLREMGKWLDEYGQTIYGTRGGPFKPTDWGVSTRTEDRIYIHLLQWFGDSPSIVVPEFGMEITSCRLLGGGALAYSREDGWHRFDIPGDAVNPINTIIEIEVAEGALDIAPMEVPPQSKSFMKEVTASSNPDPRWRGASSVTNGDWVGHYWMPGEEDREPWIEIDLGEEAHISRAILFEASRSIEKFELQCKKGGEWVPVYQGETIGEKSVITFPETETRAVRLLITACSETPGIYEVVLL
jgi:alpha-L-fucosidase